MILLKDQMLKKILINENFQLALISLVSFLIPFFFRQPQLVIGSIINLLLIFSVSKFDPRKLLPLIFIPSISSLLSGVLFGTFTPYLIFVIPFIAIANLIFILAFKFIKYRYIRVVVSALLKASFLFSCTYIISKFVYIPDIFFATMGIMQLITALMGALSFEVLSSFSKHYNIKQPTA